MRQLARGLPVTNALPVFFWIVIYGGALIWSGVSPVDRLTWAMEMAPAILAAGAMGLTYKKFRLTPLVYWLILAHCLVLMIGGKYTYAHVPLFDAIKDALGGERNDYDKVGHFMQGCVPVLVAREIILRKGVAPKKHWANFFSATFCLAFSALYEIIEWGAAVALGKGADAFLGTQGYAWDTQSDMAFALIGAAFGLLVFSRAHDAQIGRRLISKAPAST